MVWIYCLLSIIACFLVIIYGRDKPDYWSGGAFGNWPCPACTIPTIIPNNPRADPKISTISIFTKSSGFCASPKAQPLPDIPTHTPQNKLDKPTLKPTANKQYPATNAMAS
ncbi:hypothetical protein C9890_0300, partial [Perkinsus sp. BL_2016]